jgi:RND family efflux transporter MFP subunit
MHTPSKPFSRHIRAIGLLSALAMAASGCEGSLQSNAHAAAAQRAKVTVAQPVVASVAEFSEHTGRTEAPDAVEIRPRASGHLVRAAFHEGDLVKKGDLLFVIDPRPYEAALSRTKAELEAARADLELAHKNLARANQLYERGTITEREWDARSTEVLQLAARQALVSATLEGAQLDLDYAYVRSPIHGRVGRMLITPGNLVGPSLPTPLTTVVSIDPLYVYIDVDETRAMQLGRGQDTTLRVLFPGDETAHEAKIDFVDTRVDANTGTLRVRAVLRNRDGKLTPGLFARVQLPQGKAEPAMMVADRAIATDQDRRYVWVIDKAGKAQYRAVTLGQLQEGLRVVRSGLSADDRVVVRGLQRVRAGTEVDIEQVSMRDLDAPPVTAQLGEVR